eukprot:g3816.t1
MAAIYNGVKYASLKSRAEGHVGTHNPILGTGHTSTDEMHLGYDVEGRRGMGTRGPRAQMNFHKGQASGKANRYMTSSEATPRDEGGQSAAATNLGNKLRTAFSSQYPELARTNFAPPEDLMRLCSSLGIAPGIAQDALRLSRMNGRDELMFSDFCEKIEEISKIAVESGGMRDSHGVQGDQRLQGTVGVQGMQGTSAYPSSNSRRFSYFDASQNVDNNNGSDSHIGVYHAPVTANSTRVAHNISLNMERRHKGVTTVSKTRRPRDKYFGGETTSLVNPEYDKRAGNATTVGERPFGWGNLRAHVEYGKNPLTGEGHISWDMSNRDLDGRLGAGTRGAAGNRRANHQNAWHFGRHKHNIITGEGLRAFHSKDHSGHLVEDGEQDTYAYYKEAIPSFANRDPNLRPTKTLAWSAQSYPPQRESAARRW